MKDYWKGKFLTLNKPQTQDIWTGHKDKTGNKWGKHTPRDLCQEFLYLNLQFHSQDNKAEKEGRKKSQKPDLLNFPWGIL